MKTGAVEATHNLPLPHATSGVQSIRGQSKNFAAPTTNAKPSSVLPIDVDTADLLNAYDSQYEAKPIEPPMPSKSPGQQEANRNRKHPSTRIGRHRSSSRQRNKTQNLGHNIQSDLTFSDGNLSEISDRSGGIENNSQSGGQKYIPRGGLEKNVQSVLHSTPSQVNISGSNPSGVIEWATPLSMYPPTPTPPPSTSRIGAPDQSFQILSSIKAESLSGLDNSVTESFMSTQQSVEAHSSNGDSNAHRSAFRSVDETGFSTDGGGSEWYDPEDILSAAEDAV